MELRFVKWDGKRVPTDSSGIIDCDGLMSLAFSPVFGSGIGLCVHANQTRKKSHSWIGQWIRNFRKSDSIGTRSRLMWKHHEDAKQRRDGSGIWTCTFGPTGCQAKLKSTPTKILTKYRNSEVDSITKRILHTLCFPPTIKSTMTKLLRLLFVSLLLMANAFAKAFPSPATANTIAKPSTVGWTNKKPVQTAKTLHNKKPLHTNNAVASSSRSRSQMSSLQALPAGGGVGGGAASLMAFASSIGSLYAHWLKTNPVLTKSVTAALSFGIADWLAQFLTQSSSTSPEKPLDFSRVKWAMLVGLVYYGPAAHAWYEGIFQAFPGTSFGSTLLKAILGQLSFSPAFTCVFFATALIRSGTFSMGNWFNKIGNDLPQAWVAGLSFWPLMDVVSYSFIGKDYIPLFNTCCAFVWTIYLSLVSNRLQRA